MPLEKVLAGKIGETQPGTMGVNLFVETRVPEGLHDRGLVLAGPFQDRVW